MCVHSQALHSFIRQCYVCICARLLINFHFKISLDRSLDNIDISQSDNNMNKNQFISLRFNCRKNILHKSSLLIHPRLIFVSRAERERERARECERLRRSIRYLPSTIRNVMNMCKISLTSSCCVDCVFSLPSQCHRR